MIKKHGLWFAVKYYCIIQFIIFAIGLFIANDYVFNIACSYMNITERSPFFKLFQLAVPIGLAALWFFIFFTVCRDKTYRYKTGRNFGHDNGKYKRTYAELVEYFQDAVMQRELYSALKMESL